MATTEPRQPRKKPAVTITDPPSESALIADGLRKAAEGVGTLIISLTRLIELQQVTETAIAAISFEAETRRVEILSQLEATKIEVEAARLDSERRILAELETTKTQVEADRLQSERRILAEREQALAIAEADRLASEERLQAEKEEASALAEDDRLASEQRLQTEKEEASKLAETDRLRSEERLQAEKEEASALAEADRLRSERRIRAQTLRQFAVVVGLTLVLVVGGLWMLRNQADAVTEAANVARDRTEQNDLAFARIQCVSSLQSNWQAKFSAVINITAQGGVIDRQSPENAKTYAEFNTATDLVNRYQELCYAPEKPNPNPIGG